MWFYFFKRDFKRSFSPPSSLFFHLKIFYWSFPSCIKEATKNFGEGNGNPLQYFCLENSVDRRAWQATVHGVAKESDTTEQHTHTHTHTQKALEWQMWRTFSFILRVSLRGAQERTVLSEPKIPLSEESQHLGSKYTFAF